MSTSDDKKKNVDCGTIEDFHKSNPLFPRIINSSFTSRQSLADPDFWKKKSDENHCFFCGYQFSWPPFPMPIKINGTEVIVDDVVYCTPSCVKSELVKSSGYYVNQRLQDLTNILRDYYNYYDIPKTVEKKVFKRYGGDITHEEYIQNIAAVCELQIVYAPFICQPSCIQGGLNNIFVKRIEAKSSKSTLLSYKPESKEVGREEKETKESKESKEKKKTRKKMDVSVD
jgi:hypothetical protein